MVVPREICDKLNVSFVDAPLHDVCGVARQTLKLRPLHALRLPLTHGTTGWYIWGGDYSSDNDFYQAIHTYHLEESVPELIKFLGLPPGHRVLLAEGYEDVWFDESLLNPE